MSKENTPTEITMTTNPAVGGGAPAASEAATAQPSAAQFLLYREAFEQALPASAEISDSELLPVNIDVPSAVATAVGALPKILAHRSEAAQLPGFDISHFDQLQLHTFAVGHAHAKFLAASTPPEELAALNERGMELRDTMYSDAVALAHRDLISGERIASFKANATPIPPLNLLMPPRIPSGTRVMCFHGEPKMEEAMQGYRGKWYHAALPATWLANYWLQERE